MLITEEYRKLNEQLHKNTSFGSGGTKWIHSIKYMMQDYNVTSVLDYGCGKGTVKKVLGDIVKEYDPCIEGKTDKVQCEMAVCTDVLEHVEPDFIENVLDDIQSLCTKCAFITIGYKPAKKTLADGRNAHLIIEDDDYWTTKLSKRFKVLSCYKKDVQIVYKLECLK